MIGTGLIATPTPSERTWPMASFIAAVFAALGWRRILPPG